MRLLAGKQWREYFDVIIVQARKPKFFTDESRPIRLYEESNDSHAWDRVSKLEKGQIYYEVLTHRPITVLKTLSGLFNIATCTF